MIEEQKPQGKINPQSFDLLDCEERRCVERSGALIQYALAKPRQGQVRGTLMLVHGVGSNASRWEEFTEKTSLRRNWQILRIDLRGHGGSECLRRASLEMHADDCAAVLDDAGIDRAVLVGHSLGAHIVMTMAQRHPNKVAGLILMDPLISEALTDEAHHMSRKRPLVRTVEAVCRLFNKCGFKRRIPHYSLREHDRLARKMLARGGDALEEFIHEYSSPIKDLEHIHTANYARDLLEVGRRSPDMKNLKQPMLVMCATSGKFTSSSAMAAWVKGLENATLVHVDCVHWPLTECPEQVSAKMEHWINEEFPN